jgi:hypothetical protein
MAAKNFYVVLGVAPDAPPTRIRDAYRALAKKYHPDRGSADETAFREVTEAYEALSNPVRRRLHDRELGISHRDPASIGLAKLAPHRSPSIPEPLIANRVRASRRPLERVGLDVVLTAEEAMLGGVLPIEVAETTLHLQIPPLVADGTIWDLLLTDLGLQLRVHLRVAPW